MIEQIVDPSISVRPIPSTAKDLPTVCVLCSHNCGIRVDVDDNRITSVRPDESNPITAGYICNKGFTIPSYVQHSQRVEHPMRRRADGTFERITWEVAIREIAAKLLEIRERHSARAIGLVGIGGQGNHMDGLYGLSILRGLGSRRFFNAFAQEKTQHNMIDGWMMRGAPATMLHPDQENSRLMMIMGTNPKVSHRGHCPTESLKNFAADPTKTMIVVDPRITDTSRSAKIHLRLKPGTDCYLLLGMIKVILDQKLYDERFVNERSVGLDDVVKAFAKVDATDMAARCGLDSEAIADVATRFATSGASSILFDLGIEQTRFSTLISYLLRLLLALTGNLGRRGGNVYFESVVPPEPVRGAHQRETERALVSGIHAIRALGDFAMFSPTLVPEEVLNDHPQRLRALIVEGSNPLLSYSDSRRWREAAEKLDLLVAIDPAFTETARLAHYVLPTGVGYEKWEFAIFPKGYPEVYAQVRPPVVAPPAEALPEPEIYVRLGEAMNLYGEPPALFCALAQYAHLPVGRALFFIVGAWLARRGATDPSDDGRGRLLFWIYRTLGRSLPSPALSAIYLLAHANAFTRRADILRTLGPKWNRRSPFALAAELYRRMLAHPEGVEILKLSTADNLGDHIHFEDKRIRLAPKPILTEIDRAVRTRPQSDSRYPFVLATGLRTRWTANTIQRDPAWRKGRGPHCTLSVSPADAERLGIKSDDIVRVETSRNAVELPAFVDDRLQPGHMSIPNGFGMIQKQEGERIELDGVNINELTDVNDRDPFTGCPHHKYVPCRVEKVLSV